MSDISNKNTGVILATATPNAYVAGIISGIVYQERLVTKDWTNYRSPGEWQKGVDDYMDCVTESWNNDVEDQINWFKATGQLTDELISKLLTPDEAKLFADFFNPDGTANLSDRVLAQRSGTTKNGNTFERVGATGRGSKSKPGVAVPEKVWPFDKSMDWDAYYKPCPQDIIDKYSKIFFKVFNITNELIPAPYTREKLLSHLGQCPIQIAVGACPGWNSIDPVPYCGRHMDHAVVNEKIVGNIVTIGDSYSPFLKNLSEDYQIDAAQKIIVDINSLITAPMLQVKENVLYQLVEGEGGFALGLNGKLIIDDLAKVIASWAVRNNGNFAGKIATCSLADWQSVPHYNLKMEPVE